MTNLTNAVRCHLNDNGFNYNTHNSEVFEFGISGNNGNFKVFIHCNEQKGLIQIMSVSPINVRENQKSSICDLLNRINDYIMLGKFSMDNETGEITYKSTGIYADTFLSDRSMGILLHTNIQTFDEHLPAIISVNYGHAEPLMAFLEVLQAA